MHSETHELGVAKLCSPLIIHPILGLSQLRSEFGMPEVVT